MKKIITLMACIAGLVFSVNTAFADSPNIPEAQAPEALQQEQDNSKIKGQEVKSTNKAYNVNPVTIVGPLVIFTGLLIGGVYIGRRDAEQIRNGYGVNDNDEDYTDEDDEKDDYRWVEDAKSNEHITLNDDYENKENNVDKE